MRIIIEWVTEIWNAYWGEGKFQYLLLIAIVYLLIKMRKVKTAVFMAYYTICALLVFLCPLTAWFISKCIGKSVYWRVLWIVPSVPVISIAAADFIRKRKKVPKAVCAAMLVLIAALSGKSMISAGNYVWTDNYQQVPEEVVQICTLIRQDAGDGEVHLAGDDLVASYARVYDPAFYMPYGRGGRDAVNKKAKTLYKKLVEGTDYEKAASLARTLNCNYIAAVIPDEEQRAYLELQGYFEIGTSNDYRVFALR